MDTSAYTIFSNALEWADPAARERYVLEICAGKPDLYGRVTKLLRAHDQAGGFFSQPLKSGKPAPLAGAAAVPGVEKAGDTIGRYKLLEQIGEGGWGVVYMAEQQEPVRRRVALKVIKLGMDTKQVVARFEAERQALALMDHPNIAKVLDAAATDTGRPYFVMELVRGIKITEFCDEKKLSAQERLELFLSVCRAVEHAHQKGIIHRDLKPSNILVTIVDGAPVPKVIDFGVAKATSDQPLTDKTMFTAFAQFIGTPAYMSPEQAEMSGVDIDTRTDIYSLGVVLYELLTGRTPFDAEALLRAGLHEIRRTICNQEPAKPSTRLHTLSQADLTTTARARHVDGHKLIQVVQGDLDWIVMKCLEKERGRRYETVNGLAADILRHLNTEPVLARPPSRWYEFQKTVRRHQVGFAATAALILVLSIGVLVSTWEATRASRAEREQIGLRQQSDQARARAETAERETRQQLFTALLEQARATVKSGELGQRGRALQALGRAAAISNTVELRREVLAALAQPDMRLEGESPYGSTFIGREPDPNFERIALGRGTKAVEVRAVSDQRLLASLPASTNLQVDCLKWSPDGRFLAVGRRYPGDSGNDVFEVWEVASARQVFLVHDVPGACGDFHPKLPLFIAGVCTRAVSVRDLGDGAEIGRFPVPGVPYRIRYAPEGGRAAIAFHVNQISTVAVHDVASGRLLASHAIGEAVHEMDWHPGGRWLVTADESGALEWIDTRSGEVRLLGRHQAQAVSLAFSPDGHWLLSGGWEKKLICWDMGTMQKSFTIALESFAARFSADGQSCAVLGPSNIQWYRFQNVTALREFAEDLGGRLPRAAFSEDGRWLAASASSRAAVWDLSSPGPGTITEEAFNARFYFRSNEVFGTRSDRLHGGDCFRWRITPGKSPGAAPDLVRLPLRKPEGFESLALTSSGVVMVSSNGAQLLAGDELVAGQDQWARTVSGRGGVSPDGRWLAIHRPFSSILDVYRLPHFEAVAQLKHPSPISDFEFSPVDDEVAIGSTQNLEIWSTRTWQRTRATTNAARELLYAPDGTALWIGDLRRAGLYDARTFAPLLPLPAGMLPLAVSGDGRLLAVSVDGRRPQVWDLGEVRRQLRELGLDWENDPAGPGQTKLMARPVVGQHD